MIRPHKIIGEQYLHRWHLVPRNPIFNVYLHKFLGSDDERVMHDHPWHSVSFLLKGKLLEFYQREVGVTDLPGRRRPRRFLPVFRSARHAHRLQLVQGPAWTIFITGPRIREWGFLCPNGWRHWSTMATRDGKMIGGCE